MKVRRFRGATIDDLKDRLVSLLKQKPENIKLHIGMNDAVSKTSRQILDELFQLKQYITNILPTCRVTESRPTIRTDNGKAALTLSNFNKHLGQLEVDFIHNVNTKEVHYPVGTGHKLNVHKTIRKRPGRLLNVLSTFNLRPVSTG